MRTNVTLEDDVYQLATTYAQARGITLGAALGELVRKAKAAPRAATPSPRLIIASNGLRIIPSRGGGVIASQMVEDALEEDDLAQA